MADIEDPRTPRAYSTFSKPGNVSVGRFSAAANTAWRNNAVLSNIRMVLDLRLSGGVSVMASTRRVEFSSTRTGRSFASLPVLVEEPQIVQQVSLGGGGPATRSLSFQVKGDTPILDPAALMARGDFFGVVAEVFLIEEGGNYDERVVVMRGEVGGVSFGSKTLALTVSDPSAEIDIEIPPWTLDSGRWPNIDDSAVGERLPIVLNGAILPCPRINSSASGTGDWFSIGYGHGFTLSGVTVNGAAASGVLATGVDGRGLPGTVVVIATGAADENDAVYASVVKSGENYSVPRAIRKILMDFSGLGAVGLSETLFATADARFPPIGFTSGVRTTPEILINEATKALSYVEDLLADYPMLSMVYDGTGLGPVVIDHRAQPTLRLTAGTSMLIDRETALTESSRNEMSNKFVVRYDYKPARDLWAGITRRGPKGSALCQASAARIGVRDFGELQLYSVRDASMAEYILDWLVEHLARPSYTVEYHGAAILYLIAKAGDTVALTDSEFGWSGVPAIIEQIAYLKGRVTLRFRVYPPVWGAISGAAKITL